MGLHIEPVVHNPPSRRRMRLDVDADILLRVLQSLDGKRRIKVDGLPADVRCVALKTDMLLNTITMGLESSEWPEVPDFAIAPQLDLHLHELLDPSLGMTHGLD